MELKYILGAILLLYCVLAIISNIIKNRKAEKEKKKLERKEELNEKISKSTEKNIELSKKKEENKQQHYENVEVVYKISEHQVIVKRNKDNTYIIVNRKKEYPSPKINEVFEIEVKKANTWDWSSEEEYIKQRKLLEVEERLREKINERKQTLLNYGIEYLYHMTHKNNLEGILRNGLKSHNEIRKENVNNVDISDNEVNNRRARRETIFNRSIHDYVPLYFNPKNPMLYVRKDIQDDIIILAIDPMLLYEDSTLFTNGNAAANATLFYNDIYDLENLDCINADYWSTFQDGKRIRCSEALIYPKIGINHIMKIFCSNSYTRDFVKHKIDNFANKEIKVEIEPDLYFDIW